MTALGGIDLSVPEGQLTALVGPDGAGKTTLMRLVCGLMTKTDGSLQVAGLDVTQRPQAVQDLLSAMKGGIPVFINLPQEGITLLSPRSMWVENAARAREVLTPLIQAENIKIVEKA